MKIKEFPNKYQYREANLSIIEDSKFIQHEKKLRKTLISKFTDLIGISRSNINFDFINDNINSSEMLINVICSMIPMNIYEKQKLLELNDLSLRLELTIRFIESELFNNNTGKDIEPGMFTDPTLD